MKAVIKLLQGICWLEYNKSCKDEVSVAYMCMTMEKIINATGGWKTVDVSVFNVG